MFLDVAISATVLLSLAWVLLSFSRCLDAAAKHRLCVTALALAVLLPAMSLLPFSRPVALANVVLTSASLPDESESSIPFFAVWAAGPAFVLLRFAAGIVYLTLLTRRGSSQVDCFVPAHVEVRCCDVNTPMMWGWLRPTILLPRSFNRWSDEMRRAAVDHELAHVSRRDSWIALVVTVAQAMYWFHPLVWWFSRRLVEQREFLADDRVLDAGTDAVTYAALLLNFAQSSRASRLLGCAMVGGALRKRVERLLRPKSSRRAWTAAVASGFSLVLLLSCALLAPAGARLADEVYNIGGSVEPPQLAHKTEPGYTKKARRDKTQGTVLLGMIISKEGKPQAVHVDRSLTPDLDKKAIAAVYSWRFKPAMKEGKAVAVRVKVEVNFRLL